MNGKEYHIKQLEKKMLNNDLELNTDLSLSCIEDTKDYEMALCFLLDLRKETNKTINIIKKILKRKEEVKQ